MSIYRKITRLLTRCEQAGEILCRNRNTLAFLHDEEEPADIHVQLDVQVGVAVNLNAFDHRIDDHFLGLNSF
jgi:hypothetical protein